MRKKRAALGIIVGLMLLYSPFGVNAGSEDSCRAADSTRVKTPSYFDQVRSQADSMEVVGDTIIYRLNGQIVAVIYRAWDEKIPQALVELKERFESDSLRAKGYVLKEEYRPIRNTKGEVFLAIGYNAAYIVDTSAVLGTDDSDTAKVRPDTIRALPRTGGSVEQVIHKDSIRARAGPVRTIDDLLSKVVAVVKHQESDAIIEGSRAFEVFYIVPEPGEVPHVLAGFGPRVVAAGIEGQVINSQTGEPIRGVSVVVVGTKYSAVTDSDGEFSVRDIPVGEYEILLSHKDYRTIKVKAQIDPSVDPRHLLHALERKKQEE